MIIVKLEVIKNINENGYEESKEDLTYKNKKLINNDLYLKNKRILTLRVGYRSSKSECNLCTIYPTANPNINVLLWEVAHIIEAVHDYSVSAQCHI